jgi:DNA-binding transcriptional LysR family regulator
VTGYTHWFIRARLKTRQMLLLVAVADEGNIHRAAEAMNITQPAASKLLKDLEDVLGVTLFERRPRGMFPTVYGQSLIRHSRVALSSLNQAFAEIQDLKKGLSGTVNIGAITTPAITLLPSAVAEIKRAHPNIQIVVHIDTSDVLHRGLDQGAHDFLVARLFASHDKSGLSFEPLADEPAAAAVRPGHPLLSQEGIALRDLVDKPWIVPPAGTALRHRFDLMLQGAGLKPPTDLIETTGVLFITKVVAECDAICLLAADVARYYEGLGVLKQLPVELPCNMDAFGVITRSTLELSPAAKMVLNTVRRIASEVYWGRVQAHATDGVTP